MWRRWSQTENEQIVAWTQACVPAVEQAKRLGRDYQALCAHRQRLAKRGMLMLSPRPRWRPWTPAELDKLTLLLERGESYDRIARKLKRSRTAIVIKCKRKGTRLLTVCGVYTARDVAELLGLGCSKTVSRWIALGWLKATNGGEKGRPLWRIQMEHLWTFLENPDYWMAWSPVRSTDPDLHEWTSELRAGKPQWLTPGEVAKRLGVTHEAVNQWIHKGYLTSVKYGNHWIREDQLDGFVVPIDWERCFCGGRIDPRRAAGQPQAKPLCASCFASFQVLSNGSLIRVLPAADIEKL